MSVEPQAEAHFRMLVATGRECSHPIEFRGPPPFPSQDPREWECGVCGTVQAFRGPTPTSSPRPTSEEGE